MAKKSFLKLTAVCFALMLAGCSMGFGLKPGSMVDNPGDGTVPDTKGNLTITGFDAAYSGNGYAVHALGRGDIDYYFAGADLDLSTLPLPSPIPAEIESDGSVTLRVWREGIKPDYIPVGFNGNATIMFYLQISGPGIQRPLWFGDVTVTFKNGKGTAVAPAINITPNP